MAQYRFNEQCVEHIGSADGSDYSLSFVCSHFSKFLCACDDDLHLNFSVCVQQRI
jgi:hypothetical protein